MADQNALKQIVDKLKDSSNVLVTVNSSPSVDELSAALAITLLINKLNKHATAVFSGAIPPAIEFLEPQKTFENTVDSLRDFIIALDKEKADHLRYKVVDDMVKIFITPYRTTINENDLEFSQGDYNVEVVLAIGVQNETDLDRALESHGRILHDATVAAISLGEPTKLGGIEWNDARASSYSELLFQLADSLKGDKNVLDEQIATAFLTGIVAATERFSNQKTSSEVMTIAARLMAAGANQQLIATKLQENDSLPNNTTLPEPEEVPVSSDESEEKPTESNMSVDDGVGALSISHEPEGDVDEVTKEVEEKESSKALDKAEAELEKQTAEVANDQQEDAMAAAEKRLAEQLKTVSPGIAMTPPADDAPVVTHEELEASEPSLGGTLNATTEQAAEDKRREIENDKNHTILSHGGSYTADAPTMQAPLNAVTSAAAAEPAVADIFANGGTADDTTAHADAIEPPTPDLHLPTLEELDEKNRADHTDARAAVSAALSDDSAKTDDAAAASTDLPQLPPLPPMPDFSTLPPLPGDAPSAPPVLTVPDTLGDTLPPAPTIDLPSEPAQPNDPAQFKIPGQS